MICNKNDSLPPKRYDNMDENDFESLKQKRMAALKQQQAKKQEWLANGHGR